MIRDGQKLEIEHTERELSGKIIREYRFNIQEDDYFVMMSDGVTHAGVGGLYGFGWGRTRVGEFIQQRFNDTKMTAARLASYVINECSQLYHQRPGDDTTVVVAKVTARMDLNISQVLRQSEKMTKVLFVNSCGHRDCMLSAAVQVPQ